MYYINKHIIDINNERDRIHILFNKDLIQTRNNIGNNVIYCGYNLSIMYYTIYDENLKSNKYYIYLSIN